MFLRERTGASATTKHCLNYSTSIQKKFGRGKLVREFQEIVLAAVEKGTRELAGREFDKNQLKNLCAFLIRAENTARERRFFHWELEFPEVFFEDDGSPRESPGFDAVIGNPPYVDIKGLETETVDYIFKVFPSARLRVNIFAAFIEQEVGMSRSGQGHVGAIIPTAFLTQLSYSTLRKLVLAEGWLKKSSAYRMNYLARLLVKSKWTHASL